MPAKCLRFWRFLCVQAMEFFLVPALCLNVLLWWQSWCNWGCQESLEYQTYFKSILDNWSPFPSIFCYRNTGFSLSLWNIFDRSTGCPCAPSCATHLREQLCAAGLMAGPGAGESRSLYSEDRSMKASGEGSSSSDCPRSSVRMNQDMVSDWLN